MNRYNVLITTPLPFRKQVLSEEALARLQGSAHVTMNEDGHNWTAAEIAERLSGMDAMLSSWDLGKVKLTPEVLARADRLRFIGYAAGSVKGWASEELFDRGILVSHVAARIADSVAEYALLLALLGLRRPHNMGRTLGTGVVQTKYDPPTYEIAGQRVGLLGLGHVGRRAARVFQAVRAEVWAYDPYMTPERAQELGVRKAGLDELLSGCRVVSSHLPATPKTRCMLGAREFALMREGAVFVNTARAWSVDQDAMIEALKTGRIFAALDVAEPDPLPADHPLRQMDNVFYSPHISGPTTDALYQLMGLMIDEAERCFRGEPLKYQVTKAMLATMA